MRRGSATATCALVACVLAAGPAAAAAPAQERCSGSLNELVAKWRELTSDKGPARCARRASLWLQLRQCFKGYGAWLPPIESVGDCFVEAGNRAAADEFYRAVVMRMRDLDCNREGTSCAVLAAQELRRLDCGFAWLASEPRQAWTDFVDSVSRPRADTAPTAHVEPYVRSDRAPFSTSCPSDAFAVPGSFTDGTVSVPDASALDRSALVPIKATDQAWRNFAPGVYKFFRVRVCPYNRPSLQVQPRYFVQIRPVVNQADDPPCARTLR